MKNILFNLCKSLLVLSVIFIVFKDISLYIKYKLDVQLYEMMATKYNCTFLTPSASRDDVGMFDCDNHIIFKKIEK